MDGGIERDGQSVLLTSLPEGFSSWKEYASYLANHSLHDGLTGLWNRRAFDGLLVRELDYSRRHGSPLSVGMVDIDCFKDVNDGYGHPQGDAVLRLLAGYLAGNTRDEDLVARYGGEEIALVFRDHPEEVALHVMGRLHGSWREHYSIAREEGSPPFVTFSAGVAEAGRPGRDADLGACAIVLIEHADRALYHSKRNGRDRVTAYSSLPPEPSPL